MRKFLSYPIFINRPTPAGDPEPSAVAFEDQVYYCLTRIASTSAGQLLLNALDTLLYCWIVPMSDDLNGKCGCTALTFPGSPAAGGIDIFIPPVLLGGGRSQKTGAGLPYQWYGPDDVLFHELVHAYRMGTVGSREFFPDSNNKPMRDYGNAEEFFAVQMQNVYLASLGNPRFYLGEAAPPAGWSVKSVSKGTAYASFVRDTEVLRAFRYFLNREPLAKEAALLKLPLTTFNPWRDLPHMEGMFLTGGHDGGRTRVDPLWDT